MRDDRIGVCSWSLQPSGPADLVERVRASGVTAVQLALSPIINDPTTWEGVFDELEAAGLRVVSGMLETRGEDYSTLESIAQTGGVRPDEHWEANLAHARALAELAQRRRIRLVTFHAGFVPEHPANPERARLIDRLRTLADVFEQCGVRLGLETGQETANTLLDMLDALDRPGVGVNFDPANMILYDKGDPVKALRDLAPHITQLHIKDAVRTTVPGTWGAEVLVGEGDVDWDAFFAVAAEIKPIGRPLRFIVEREHGETRAEDIARAVGLIESFLVPS